MPISKEDLDRVTHVHLKRLVKNLDDALAKERGGGTPLTSDEYLKLHRRADRYILLGIIASTEDND